MTNPHSVSIVIPTYNGAVFLSDAMESVLNQTRLPSEIIVVDDFSTDNTVELAHRLAVTSKVPIKVIKLPINSGGPARPINTGVAAANGDLILVLDQDDVLVPNALENGIQVFDSHPSCDVVFHLGGRFEAPESGPIQSAQLCHEMLQGRDGRTSILVGIADVAIYACRFGMIAYGYPGFIFRKSGWEAKRGVDESLRVASDMDFFLWLAQRGGAVLVPEIGYLRREHGNNVTHNAQAMYLETGTVLVRFACDMSARYPGHRVANDVFGFVFGLAYWFRVAHLYSESLQLILLLDKLGIRKRERIVFRIKIMLHKYLSSLLRLKPTTSFFTRKILVRPLEPS